MTNVFARDFGFTLDFDSEVDLSAMDSVRVLIRQPGGAVVKRDLTSGQFSGVVVGGTLSYLVGDTDIPIAGKYLFQVIAKDASSDFAFTPFELVVGDRLSDDDWS